MKHNFTKNYFTILNLFLKLLDLSPKIYLIEFYAIILRLIHFQDGWLSGQIAGMKTKTSPLDTSKWLEMDFMKHLKRVC